MAYFGGGGVKVTLHPSLKTYIDCFLSPPFPKMFPRGGGIWDQDPILIRDFRVIRNFELEWKEVQDASGSQGGGGIPGLKNALDEYIGTLDPDEGTPTF